MTIQQILNEGYHNNLTSITNSVLSLIKKKGYLKAGEYDISNFIQNSHYRYTIRLVEEEKNKVKAEFIPYLTGGGKIVVFNINVINNNLKTNPEAMNEKLTSLLNHELTHLLDYDKVQNRVDGVVKTNGKKIDAFELNAYIHSAIEYAKKYDLKIKNRHELCKLLYVSQPGYTSIALDTDYDKKLLARVYRRFSEAGIIADNYDTSSLKDENGEYPEEVKNSSFRTKHKGELKF